MPPPFLISALTRKGQIVHDDPMSLQVWSSLLGEGVKVVGEYRKWYKVRTTQQNKAFHGLMVPAFAQLYGYFPWEHKQAKITLLEQVFFEIRIDRNGHEHRVAKSTSKLTTQEFSNLWKLGADYLASEYNYVIPEPDPMLARI